MPRSRYITKSELLKELEQRLPDFTQDELVTLLYYLQKHQQRVMEIIQLVNPKIYDWCYEKANQLQAEKSDQAIEKLKKSLTEK